MEKQFQKPKAIPSSVIFRVFPWLTRLANSFLRGEGSPTNEEPGTKNQEQRSYMPTEQEKQWIEAWKSAGPKLQAIRDEELRQKSNKGFRPIDGTIVYDPAPHRNGLVIMQAWFQRFQILQLMRKQEQSGE